MDDVRLISVSDIVEPRSLLRLVDRNAIEYLELRDSVAVYGFTSSISVRQSIEWPGRFEIIEGVHRFSVAKDLRLPEMPCIIKNDISDDQLLILQIQGNAQTVPTKPVEYARQIKQLLTRKPGMEINELAVTLKKSPKWISTLLGLLKLPESLQKIVDRGDMPLISGYMLSRMPRRLQLEFAPQAQKLPAEEFRRLASATIKHFQEAVAHGRLEEFYTREFTPHPYLRHLKEIQAEMAHHHVGPLLVASLGCQSPLDGFYAALQWFIHLDPESIREQRDAARARERNTLQEPPDVVGLE